MIKRAASIGWLLFGLLAAVDARALTCTSAVGAVNWNTIATWSCGRVPLNVDDVVIANGSTVTVNTATGIAGSVTINAGATATALNLGGVGTSLTVTNAGGLTGNVVINGSTGNVLRTLAVGARTLSVTGNFTINGGTAGGGGNNTAQLTVTTGTATINGNLALNAGTVNNNRAQATVTTGRITVDGNVTLTGGVTSNTRDALLSVTGASAVGNGVIIGGTLNVNSTLATTSTVSITAAGGRITVNGAGGVNNGDTITVGAGIFSMTSAAATFTTSNTSIASSTTVALNGQLNITGNAAVTGGSLASSAASMTGTAGTISITGNATATGGSFNPSSATMSVTTGVLTVGGNLGITAGSNTNTNATVSVTTGRITVTGNTTVTGGAAAGRNALLTVTGAPAVAGNGANIDGTLNLVTTAAAALAASATASITAANGVINVNGAGGVNNGGTVSVGTGLFSMTNAAATFTTTSNVVAPSTTVTGGTLAIAGNANVTGGTVNPSGATMSVTTGVITVGGNLGITAGSNTNTNATVSVTTGRITVTGNTTVTGGAAAGRNALLTVTGAPAVAGNGANIDGMLNLVASAAGTVTSATASITAANGVINVNGAGGVNNGGTVTVGAGIFSVTNAAATYANSSAVVVANTTVSSGTLSVLGTLNNAALETMTVSTTGNITVGDTVGYAGTLTNAGTLTLTAGGVVNANGTFTNSGTFTNTAAGQLNLRGATSTVNGTFNRGTGTVAMNGGAAQNLSGSAITGPAIGASLYNLTINNASGVTLGNNVRAANTITFTSGNVTTGANALIAGLSCANALNVTRTSGHVVGNFQKAIPAGISTCVFQVGSSADYTPASLTFAAATTAGGLIGSASNPPADHPNIATSGLNAGKSVNRWWRLTVSGVSGTAMTLAGSNYSATFTFVNGDIDGGANTAAFEIERWNGAAWSTTTVGTRNPNDTTATGINALGEFAIAEKTPVVTPPGDLNAFETSTAGGAITGPVYTKLVGANFNLAIVAILGGVQHATFNEAVTVDLVTGSTGGLNCPGAPVSISGTENVTLVNGRANTATGFTIATAYRNVRVRIRWPTSSPTVTSCSTDNFAVRPTGFTVTSSNATETGTGGTTVIKTGAFFNLTATAVAGYDGTPLINNGVGMVIGTPNQGTIGGTFGAAPIGTGIAVGNGFFYSEVGNFGLAANAVYDASFTSDSSDLANGHCIPGSFSNTLSGGQYGCSVGSTVVPQTTGASGFGRFIPDNFNVTYNTPAFGNALGCGTFTYVGRSFTYSTAPVMTVTARNGTNNGLTNATTTNYAGSYVKLTNATLTPGTQLARYSRFDALGGGVTPALDPAGLPATTGDPAIGAFVSGVGTLTFSSGTGLIFTRSATTPNAPFDADIALAINVIDSDLVAFASNPAAFGAATAGNGIGFAGGKSMRYGRLRLQNASGSNLLPLFLQAEAQYWNGSAFITNAADACTTIASGNIALGAYTGTLTDTPKCLTAISGGGTLAAGRRTLQLAAPGAGVTGGVTLTANLGAVPAGNTCAATGAAPVAATTANIPYLQGNWTGGSYNQNPSGRATFGTRRGSDEIIHNRENF